MVINDPAEINILSVAEQEDLLKIKIKTGELIVNVKAYFCPPGQPECYGAAGQPL